MKKMFVLAALIISFVFSGVNHPGRQPEAILPITTEEAFHKKEPDNVDQVQEPPDPLKR